MVVAVANGGGNGGGCGEKFLNISVLGHPIHTIIDYYGIFSLSTSFLLTRFHFS